jgi:phytoene dehydrogenase-like protein
MSGLAAGIRLAMFDKRVVILERHYVWGGLNSFYRFKGRQFDVGLHAMTNFVPRGAKGKPLTRLLKQLRLRHEQLDLHEQSHSLISFPGAQLRFDNDFETLRGEVRRAFPACFEGFEALTREVTAFNELDLEAPQVSAREIVRRHINEPLLEDMLFCPLMFYGSAREHDMDWDQFCVMWKSIYHEGFARPLKGVRHVLSLLTNRYRELGGELRLRCGVARILRRGDTVIGVKLDNGEELLTDVVLSSAGAVETARLASESAACMPAAKAPAVGRLSFTESISLLDAKPPSDATIIFFSNRDRFAYRQPDEAVDVDSGVICMPGNFKGHAGCPPMVRVTNIARHDAWAGLERRDSDAGLGVRDIDPASASPYTRAKAEWYARSTAAVVGRHMPDFRGHVTLVDMFTPRTITHFTGHLGGAVYGSPVKSRTGETPLRGLYLMGTDQGFLGIVGAALSGISMANRWVLSGDGLVVDS